MRYAICNETFQDWPFERAMAFARQCGYTGIEFAPFTMEKNVRDISASRRAEVRDQAQQAGLEVVGLHWLLAFTEGYYLTSPESDVRRKTAEYFCELARLCRDLGGCVMVLGSPVQRNLLPGVSHDQALQYAADVIQQALPALEDCDVTLAVEPLGPQEGDFLLTARSGRDLINLVGSPRCQLHLDVKAMSSEGTPIDQIIRQHADVLKHFHANDANRRGPGMGDIDFVPILQALQDIEYGGWVSVEVFDYEPGVEALAREHHVLAAVPTVNSSSADAARAELAEPEWHQRHPTELLFGMSIRGPACRLQQAGLMQRGVARRSAQVLHRLDQPRHGDHLDGIPGTDLQLIRIGFAAGRMDAVRAPDAAIQIDFAPGLNSPHALARLEQGDAVNRADHDAGLAACAEIGMDHGQCLGHSPAELSRCVTPAQHRVV